MAESLMGHQCISNLCLLLYFYQLNSLVQFYSYNDALHESEL